MRLATVTPMFALLLLAGCGARSKSEHSANDAPQELEVSAEEEAASDSIDDAAAEGDAAAKPSDEIKVAYPPQIAYNYSYGYRIDADQIPTLQKAHADLCENKGANVCRILNMSQSGGEDDYASGRLEIEVAAKQARGFGEQLAKLADSKGGEQIDTSISGEDLSKQIVDTEARLRARIVLRDRLMEILRNRSGKVSELVEAERGVAEVNEEIDQAQSWLAEMKGRVAFSKMTISYNAGYPSSGGFFGPIRRVLGNAGGLLGGTVALLIGAIIIFFPFALSLWLLLWSRRKFGWHFRFWQRSEQASEES